MKKTKPKKLLTVLLTLYLALSIVPITAYAGVTDVTGGSTTHNYSLFYHTKVETTAQIIIKDADGNVAETTEVTKSGDFVEGNFNSDAVQAEMKELMMKSLHNLLHEEILPLKTVITHLFLIIFKMVI